MVWGQAYALFKKDFDDICRENSFDHIYQEVKLVKFKIKRIHCRANTYSVKRWGNRRLCPQTGSGFQCSVVAEKKYVPYWSFH